VKAQRPLESRICPFETLIYVYIFVYNMIREAKKEDIIVIDYLGHLFNKEIQTNSPLNKLKSTKYVKPKRITSSPYYEYFSKSDKIFVAIENNEIVGFVSGRILNQKDKTIEKYGKLDDLFILKKSRGSGFASKLVDYLLKYFKKNKCKQAVLFASPNKPIQKYYSKIGFDTIYYYMFKKL
jgi:ribosomal protein S18 acetylase RimI-like enzyme